MPDTLRSIGKQVRYWPLWGVLLCGVLNTLVWEWGPLLHPHPAWLIPVSLVAIAAGIVTPEKPMYTAAALALGAPLPLGHVPLAVGLVPVYGIAGLAANILTIHCRESELTGISIMTGLTLYGFLFMYGPYFLLVSLGMSLKARISVQCKPGSPDTPPQPGCSSVIAHDQ